MSELRGRVVAASSGLSNIVVTNGRDVTRTGGDGGFRLPRRATERFVSATVPAGFAPVQSFYAEATAAQEGLVIELKSDAARSETSFRFVQITDMHLSTTRRCLPKDLRDDLSRLIEAQPDTAFVVASGDLTAGGKADEFAAYREVMKQIGRPVFHAAGNHDDDEETEARHFQDALGPLHYSVDWGGLHFVVYDGEASQREGQAPPDSPAAFPYHSSTQDDWLRADLAAHSGRPTIVINHFPWGDEFYGPLADTDIIATISGHWHSSRRFESHGITHYNTPTFCFGGIDQSARGYRVFDWDGQQLSSQRYCLTPIPLWPGIDTDTAAPAIESAKNTVARPGASWRQFHGGRRRTGSAEASPAPPLRRAWSAPTGGRIHTAACVIDGDLLVQATCDEDAGSGSGLTALNVHDGRQRWRYATDVSVRHAAVLSDELVYGVTMTGQVVAVTRESGELRWSYQLGDASRRWVYSTPLLAHGRLYVGVSSHLVALDPETGQRLWLRDDIGVDDWISSYPSPAADADHLLVPFYTQPQTLLSLDPATGHTRWAVDGTKSNYVYSTPVLDDGRAYVTSGSAVRAYDLADGQVVWEQSVSLGRVQTALALIGDRLVLTTAGQVLCLGASDGEPAWSWDVPTQQPLFTPYVRSGPSTMASPVVAGEFVYVPAADGVLYVLQLQTGDLAWSGKVGAPLAAPVAVSGNAVLIGDVQGTMHCLTGEMS